MVVQAIPEGPYLNFKVDKSVMLKQILKRVIQVSYICIETHLIVFFSKGKRQVRAHKPRRRTDSYRGIQVRE